MPVSLPVIFKLSSSSKNNSPSIWVFFNSVIRDDDNKFCGISISLLIFNLSILTCVLVLTFFNLEFILK